MKDSVLMSRRPQHMYTTSQEVQTDKPPARMESLDGIPLLMMSTKWPKFVYKKLAMYLMIKLLRGAIYIVLCILCVIITSSEERQVNICYANHVNG